jgi:hypoxanthine phosphoribosyltransferase
MEQAMQAQEFLNQQGCARLPWKMLLSQETIDAMVAKLARYISTAAIATKPLVIVAILKGAFIFCADLCKKLTIPYKVYFLEASSYRGQTQGEVKFASEIVPEKLKGHHILLLDELFDNGHTMATMRRTLLQHEELELDEKDITTCVLFQKNSGTQLPLPDIVGFSNMPNVWYVGYGLDDNGEKRGWPHLFAVPKAADVPRTADDDLFEKPTLFGHWQATLARQTELV